MSITMKKLGNENSHHTLGIKDFCQKLISSNVISGYHLSVCVADYLDVLGSSVENQ